MRFSTLAVPAAALACALAAPALAADHPPAAHGKATAPGQLCRTQSHKKTDHGKGKSPFAACVVGAARAQQEIKDGATTLTAPGQLCRDQSHKKSATDTKTPFAACVVGAAKAQKES